MAFIQVIKCSNTFFHIFKNYLALGPLSENCCLSNIIKYLGFYSKTSRNIIFNFLNECSMNSSQKYHLSKFNVGVNITWNGNRRQNEQLSSFLLFYAIQIYNSTLSSDLRRSKCSRISCILFLSFSWNLLHDLFIGACSCWMAPCQGHSVL